MGWSTISESLGDQGSHVRLIAAMELRAHPSDGNSAMAATPAD
jgi:hypothetical protein